MRVKTTVLVAAIAMMVIGAAALRAQQPGKRSVLRVSNGSRTVVRPVGYDDDLPQEPPVHEPPQVNAYTPQGSRKVITLQQQAPRQMLPQRNQQLFAQPVTRRANHFEAMDEVGEGEANAAAPAPCCGQEAGGYGSPCCGHEASCCGSPCCGHEIGCGASHCCASSCCESSCCASSCCGGGFAGLFGGHCGCGHHGGCGHECCGEPSCGCVQPSCGCAHHHCGGGCGDCCHSCCCLSMPDFSFLKKLFGPRCCCQGCGHSSCGCGMDYGCSSCGCQGGGYGYGYGGAGASEAAPMPVPNNGSPSDVPPPPKVQ